MQESQVSVLQQQGAAAAQKHSNLFGLYVRHAKRQNVSCQMQSRPKRELATADLDVGQSVCQAGCAPEADQNLCAAPRQ